MTPPVENETPMEDIEEGEIADDVETSGEVVSVHDNLPISQTKAASLNDSAASRFRKDGGRREENPPSHPHTPRFVMEEGPPPGSNQWRGESLRYSNGNYSSNLYNLAWAKAVVQSKPTFSLETNNNDKGKGEILKNGGGGTGGLSRSRRDLGSEKSNDSRNGRNPKAKTDDYNEFVLASGSSSSEGNDRVVTSKKGIAENGQKKISDKVAVINISDDDDDADDDDNDEKIVNRTGDDDREEGELEEGEIDAGLASAVGSQASSSEERFENSGDFLHGGGRIDSSRALSDRHTRYRDKSPAKSSDRSWPKDQVRQSSYHQDDGKQRLKDQERERKLDVIAEMVKNVTVKDAQKSFVGVCHQLHKALECLNETNPQIPVNNVASLVKQIFAGIRAVYAVRNTWSGIQQNQDRSSAFPRLLQYVNREARNLFTSKQIKELEIMLLSVPTTVRISKADSAEEEKEERPLYAMHSSQENALKPEGREITSLNIETTTENILTKSIVTLNNANEITRDSRTLKPNEYTAAPTSTETDSRSSSSNSLSACGPESSNNSCYKPLEGFEEPDDSNLPNDLCEGSVADLNRRDSKCNSLGVQPSPKLSDPLDRSIQDENAYWQSDTVNAFTYYQEKFGGGQLSNSTRLPSPTPSEDGEEGEASNQGVEVSMFSDDKEPQQSVEEREVRDMDISENVSVPSTYGSIPQLNSDMESQVVGPRIQTDFSEELEVPAFQSKDSKGAVETGKSINIMTGSSRKLQPKNRDPRRRVAESEFYTMDLNRRPCHPDSNVITREHVVGRFLDRKHKSDDDLPQDPHNSKRLRNHSDHHLFSSGFPVVTSGCGGWLEENTVIPASTDWDQTSEMEIDSTGALSRSSDLRSDSNSIFTTDTQNATIENRNKRQKTESFYQAGISMDPVSEANKIQPNSTDINLNPRMPSVGEEERGERKETEITEIGQQTNSSVALNSNIIPSVLKDIAVNPTMLMHLIKQEQQRLSAQAAQKPEQSQQTNPPSGPTIASVITSGKVIAADPSMLKDSNLQQKTAQQAPATATKPATQVTSTAGDPGKPRMKPRDPRRILHMNSGNDIVNLNGTDKQFAPVSKQTRMASGPATTESAPKLQQAPSLPNIEQNFKEKLARIAEMLKNSEMRTLRVISSQMSVGQSVRETDPIDLEQGSIESSKFLEVDIQQAIEVPKDSSMVIPPLQSLSNENTIITQNHLNPWGDVDHLLEGLSEEQRIAIQQERARRIGEQNKMFSAKKLCLVLDLDHTLLNSAKFTEIDPVHEEMLRKKEEQDREKPQRQLFRFPHMGMWTKLRPGIWNFLDRASKLYELHVYTMGNKVYATEMAKVLDPTGTLFAGRVISKGDEADLDGDDRLPKSKDLDGVLGMESAVVIIDDSARVWPHHRHNLIVVERYMYFPCSRRQFGLPGLSLLEADVDERPEDGTLASSLAVIEKIHYNFFSNKLLHEVDVREFLAAEQQKILKDCKVVFSRVFPVGEAQPHLHPLWQMAEQFGALCTTQIDDEVTHVVALAPGTDKVNWALATGRYVVHPGWLEASALLYRRANERDFSITMNHFPCPPH